MNYIARMSGERLHELGREGATRAKEWLEATTRVDAHWVNPDRWAIPKLTFSWTDGHGNFSYDLGGVLRGGEFHQQEFLAEVKYYSNIGDQSELYSEYLAKCYRAYMLRPDRCDNFMWITWHPFLTSRWKKLCSPNEVADSVIRHHDKALGVENEAYARQTIRTEDCEAVSSRLWLIVLCERQESLVISREHRAVVRAHDIKGEK